jgi:AsmA protein
MRRVVLVGTGLVVLLAVVAIALPLLIDVERYRPWIEEKARQTTGRSLSLGKMSLRLFPVPALNVESVRVADGPLLPDRDALQLQKLSIRLGLGGLLRGRPEVRSLVLDRPALVLFRDAQGRWNYDDLLERAAAVPGTSGEGTAPRSEGPAIEVQSARIRGGTIQLYDDSVVPGRRVELEIGPVDATVRGWGVGRDTKVELKAGLQQSVLKANATISTGGEAAEAQIRIAPSRLRTADLASLLPWLGVAQVPGLEVGGEAEIEGNARIPLQNPGAIGFAGQVSLRDVSYKDAGMSRPLSGLSGSLRVDGNRAVWEQFSATLGDSTLAGQIQVEDFLRPRVGFALSSQSLNIDELAAALTTGSGVGDSEADDAGTPAAGEGGDGMLQQVMGRGTFEFGEVLFQAFRLSDLSASVGLKRSVVSLEELSTALYGGTLGGGMAVDLSGAAPRYRLDAGLTGIDVEPLLADYDPELAGLLRGLLSGNLSLATAGYEMSDLLTTAHGTGSLELSNGSLRSFSALAKIASLLEMVGGKGIGREETPFEYLRGTYSIADGKARTNDLLLHAEDLDLEGQGWIGLDATLDLAVTARFSEETTRGMVEKTSRLSSFTDSDGRLVVHLRVDGKLAEPRFGLDTRRQTDQLKEHQKDRLEDELRDRLLDILGGD